MELVTGYFARMSRYKEMGYYPVSVARYNPKGLDLFTWIKVAPNPSILKAYKQGSIDEVRYRELYLEQLKVYDVGSDLAYLENLFENKLKTKYKGYVLLCYEKSDAFCHRHILGEYISAKFDRYSIMEVRL